MNLRLMTGERLRQLRKARGWRQAEVALRLDLSGAAVSRIEKGLVDLSYSRLRQLAALYEMPLTELLDFENDQHAALRVALESQLVYLYEELKRL